MYCLSRHAHVWSAQRGDTRGYYSCTSIKIINLNSLGFLITQSFPLSPSQYIIRNTHFPKKWFLDKNHADASLSGLYEISNLALLGERKKGIYSWGVLRLWGMSKAFERALEMTSIFVHFLLRLLLVQALRWIALMQYHTEWHKTQRKKPGAGEDQEIKEPLPRSLFSKCWKKWKWNSCWKVISMNRDKSKWHFTQLKSSSSA